MNAFFKAVSLCLISVVLWLTLSNFNKSFAMLLSAAVCCGIMVYAYTYLEPVIQYFKELHHRSGWNSDAAQIVIKSTGIGMIAELSAMVCADSGNSAMAKAIRTVSAAAIMWLSLPMFQALLDLIDSMIGAI